MIFQKITTLVVLAALCLNFKAVAQAPITALRVGDKLPESFWQQEHSIYTDGKFSKQTLALHREKLLILDFWATWCGSCIKKFPLLDSLQLRYAKDVAIVLVNNQKQHEQASVLEKLKQVTLTSIVLDSTLIHNFPHGMVPHYVWIHHDRLFAITDSSLLNAQSLIAVLERYRKMKAYVRTEKGVKP